MPLLTRIKSAFAPNKTKIKTKTKTDDKSANQRSKELKTSSRVTWLMSKSGKLYSKIVKGTEKLLGRPPAEATNQTASCASSFTLPLIDPEVTRSFADEIPSEFQVFDVVSKEAHSPTCQLSLNDFARPASIALPPSPPSSNHTASPARFRPDKVLPRPAPAVSSTLSNSSALVNNGPFSLEELCCSPAPAAPAFSPTSSNSTEVPCDHHPRSEEDPRFPTPVLPFTSSTLSESQGITCTSRKDIRRISEPAPPSPSTQSIECSFETFSLPEKVAAQIQPPSPPSSSTTSSSGPSHSPVPSAPSSASSMPDDAAAANNSHGRAQWSKMKDIPSNAFEMLLKYVLPKERNIVATRVRGRTRGAYHLVVFVDGLAKDLETTHEFVVKIPAHGTPQNWTEEDEYMLIQEAEMLRYLQQTTTLPTSEIIDYSARVDNGWGFPYIVMTRLPGKSAVEIWFDKDFDFTKTHQVHDLAGPVLEKKRVNFLRSLAHEMTKLENIPFRAIGMPSLGSVDPTSHSPSIALPVDKTYVWPSRTDPHYTEARDVCRSTQDYTATGMDRWQPVPTFKDNGEHTDATMEDMGMCMVLETVFAHPVFQSPPGDTFFLQHDDLDLQNILVDDDGNITGIIDWDGSLAVPRCVAHAAAPAFLRRDWFPEESEPQAFRHLVFRTEHYRQIYAAAMVEANNPDAVYTTKSGIYQAALATICGGGHKYDFCDKLLRDIPDFRMSTDSFLRLMASGEGWKFDEILDDWVDKILKPEPPKLSMPAVLADVEARIWMTEWDGFLDKSEDKEDDKQDSKQHAEQDTEHNNDDEGEQDEQPNDVDENEDYPDNEQNDENEDELDDELLLDT